MKSVYKKISVGLVALAFVAVAGYGVKSSMSNDIQLSDLAKANIEALAFYESDDFYTGWFGYRTCVNNPIHHGGAKRKMPICTESGGCSEEEMYYPQTLNKRCN
jgi:hypothetical protein